MPSLSHEDQAIYSRALVCLTELCDMHASSPVPMEEVEEVEDDMRASHAALLDVVRRCGDPETARHLSGIAESLPSVWEAVARIALPRGGRAC